MDQDPDLTAGGPRRNDSALLRVVERQLGLNLEKRRLPLEILAIDRVEKIPTEN